LRDHRIVELQTIEARIVEAIARAEIVDAFALMVLLRGYRARGRDDLRVALEPALSRALAAWQSDSSASTRGAWLAMFVDAIALSDDERLRTAAREIVAGLKPIWLNATSVDEAAAAIEGCLRASTSNSMPTAASMLLPDADALTSNAIDALERMIAGAYAPGKGMTRAVGGGLRVRGTAGDQVRAASALLTAYEVSGRLPYSMLAEELMQQAAQYPQSDDFALSCETARVLVRLAVLHEDPGYRAAAVVAPGADYRRNASDILAAHAAQALARGAAGAIYALALIELEFPDWYAD
jgi:hypothetical protein